jgi:hypothetical protein
VSGSFYRDTYIGALQQVLVIVVHDLTQQRLTVVVEVGQF